MAKKNFSGGLNNILGNNSDSLELTILPELKSFIPALTEEERNLLKESILSEGVKESLDVWIREDGQQAIIIDGHNRYEIATELNISFSTKEHSFSTIEEVKNWMLKKQLGRRNLTDANRTYLIGLLYNRGKKERGKYDRKETDNGNDNIGNKIAENTGLARRSVVNAGKFVDGLDKLSDDFKGHILGGKQKVSKGDIQILADIKTDNKIEDKKQLDTVIKKKKKEKVKAKPVEEIKENIENENNESSKPEETEPIKSISKDYEEKYKKLSSLIETHFSGVDEVLKYSVLAQYLSVNSLLTDHRKLIDDGYTIIRKTENPTLIKIMDKKSYSWRNYKNDFKSKAERDRIFKTLLEDSKTIQG